MNDIVPSELNAATELSKSDLVSGMNDIKLELFKKTHPASKVKETEEIFC